MHKRDLPWRRTQDPYGVWVSEIMLQQTQVATVVPYWENWMSLFPTVESLAKADEAAVLSAWQGLGYYQRCRRLLDGARWVDAHGMPFKALEWRTVPGVGPYTANAIASISTGEAVPVVDGNVERLYVRIAGDGSVGPARKAAAWDWAKRNLDRRRSGDWNQALMELGATVCRPKRPLCSNCPVNGHCIAYQNGSQDRIPVRTPLRAVTKLSQEVWVPISEGLFGLRQVRAGLWWEGMWEFPRADHVDEGESGVLRDIVGPGWVEVLGTFRHSVTHHRIQLYASTVRCETRSSFLTWLSLEQLKDLPMPAPQRKVLGLFLRAHRDLDVEKRRALGRKSAS